MSDGVVFADILLVAQDLAVVRLPSADGGILGLCRMPAGAVMPAATWFSAVDGSTLPLIAHQSDHGVVVEAVIAGTPLVVSLLGSGIRSLDRDAYPWTAWSHASIHDSWAAHLAQATHALVGVLVVTFLVILIATRRQQNVDQIPPGTPLTFGRIVRSAVGGMLGFGRDSFTRFPPTPRGRGGASS